MNLGKAAADPTCLQQGQVLAPLLFTFYLTNVRTRLQELVHTPPILMPCVSPPPAPQGLSYLR